MTAIFLSSTFKDLEKERAAVEAAIHRASLKYIGMEHFGSFDQEPLPKCLEKVRSANAYVLVLAYRYGFVPPGFSISMTESEYREARQRGMPVLVYETGARRRWDDEEDPRLEALKAEVKLHHGVSQFFSPEDLAWKVICDLLREFWTSESKTETPLSDRVLADSIEGDIDQLIVILDMRAENIERNLAPYEFEDVQAYIKQFKQLHSQHVTLLRSGKLIAAHEVLGQIHKLSLTLDQNEFLQSHKRFSSEMQYQMNEGTFDRGQLICGYIGGEMKFHSQTYGLREGYDIFIREENMPPTAAVELYNKILRTVAPQV